MRKVIICVTNDLETDQRVHKVATSLKSNGFMVQLVGRFLPCSKKLDRAYGIKRFKLIFNKGAKFYAVYNIRLFIFLLFNKFDIVLANDLDTLPACFIAAKLKRREVVYDSHELFTEVPELVYRKNIQNIWVKLEKYFVSRLNKAYTVCDSISDLYEQSYNMSFEVIRNVPYYRDADQNIIKNSRPTLIYQGALNMARGLELMMDVAKLLPDYDLIICGGGDIEEQLKNKKVTDDIQNVNFLGRLSFDELQSITQKAHLGLSWEENIGKNYYYALPNKLFDYIQARIPVLVSDFPEMKKVVDKYKIGDVLNDRSPEVIAKQVRKIVEDFRNGSYIEELNKAAQMLNWENESNKLKDIFI